MAEIRVEERRGGGTTWVWILLLLLLVAAAIWYVMGQSDREGDATAPAGAATPASPAVDAATMPRHPPASTMIVVRA